MSVHKLLYLLILTLFNPQCRALNNDNQACDSIDSQKPTTSTSSNFRLGFGSCHQQHTSTPIFHSISDANLNAFTFLGDNFYNDHDDCASFNLEPCSFSRKFSVLLRSFYQNFQNLIMSPEDLSISNLIANYQILGNKLEDAELFTKIDSVLATWDDHDFGENDAGGDLSYKNESLNQFLKFWTSKSSRMHDKLKFRFDHQETRDDGIFSVHNFGNNNHHNDKDHLQLIILDTRYYRTKLKKLGNIKGVEDYIPNDDINAQLMSSTQWLQLEEAIQLPCTLRIIASSLQVLRQDNGCEHWSNFPYERLKLLKLLPIGKPVLFISGDVHYAELSAWPEYGYYDATSSGLTETWPEPHQNNRRYQHHHQQQQEEKKKKTRNVKNEEDFNDGPVVVPNFGILDIDWKEQYIKLEFCDSLGEVKYRQHLSFDQISPKLVA